MLKIRRKVVAEWQPRPIWSGQMGVEILDPISRGLLHNSDGGDNVNWFHR